MKAEKAPMARITLELPMEVAVWLRDEAKLRKCTQSHIVTEILREALAKLKHEKENQV